MKCPACKIGNVLDNEKFISCELNVRGDATSCNFIFWKNSLSKLGMEQISDDQLKVLLTGKSISLKLISPKNGKPFECSGVPEMDGKWKIKFDFEKSTSITTVKIFGEDIPTDVTPAIVLDEDDSWEDESLTE